MPLALVYRVKVFIQISRLQIQIWHFIFSTSLYCYYTLWYNLITRLNLYQVNFPSMLVLWISSMYWWTLAFVDIKNRRSKRGGHVFILFVSNEVHQTNYTSNLWFLDWFEGELTIKTPALMYSDCNLFPLVYFLIVMYFCLYGCCFLIFGDFILFK